MWICKMKKAFFTVFALCVSLCCLFFIYGANVCKLQKIDGKRTFYLHSPSSWATQKERLDFKDVPHVQGESVQFSFQGTDRQTLALVQNILREYQAEIIKTESACGVVSYYAYAPNLYKGIMLDGKRVNLHIAIGGTRVAVGSPIIFGGF